MFFILHYLNVSISWSCLWLITLIVLCYSMYGHCNHIHVTVGHRSHWYSCTENPQFVWIGALWLIQAKTTTTISTTAVLKDLDLSIFDVSFNMARSITSPRSYTRIVSNVLNDVGSDRKPPVQMQKNMFTMTSLEDYEQESLFFVLWCTAKPETVKISITKRCCNSVVYSPISSGSRLMCLLSEKSIT